MVGPVHGYVDPAERSTLRDASEVLYDGAALAWHRRRTLTAPLVPP
jgi:hypothetical protein